MKAGQQQLNDQKLSVDQVERLMDDMQETADQQQEIQEALAQAPMGQGMDDDELEEEFKRLEEEAAMEKIAMGGGSGAPGYNPAAKAAPAAPAPAVSDAAVEDEYARL